MTLRVGSLCTGYGGLDLAAEQVLGAELAWVCDYDDGPSTLLAHNYPHIPNYGDLIATDWAAVEPVDVMTGGWPCQPWSTAGKQKGTEDDRAIWPAVAATIRAVRPRIVVLENVPAIAGAGELARAVGDLAQSGYVGSWRSLRAADVGAPHRRERIFIVAVATADTAHVGHQRCRDTRGRWARPADCGAVVRDAAVLGRYPRPVASGSRRPGVEARGSGVAAPDPAGDGRVEGWPESARVVGGSDAALCRDAVADSNRHERARERHEQQGRSAATGGGAVDWAGYGPAIERWAAVVGRPAPAPTVLGKRGGRQLSPLFVEWMMGLDLGHVTGVPGLTRNQQLKLLGNGVVPQQAAHALRLLLPVVLDRAAVAA